jgi:predicted enzyme related to lactoylglutathione lyase
MAVTGIGGVFFKAKDPHALQQWYELHLGIRFETWGTVFHWEHHPQGSTSFSINKESSTHYPGTMMINFRVEKLEEMLMHFAANGIEEAAPMQVFEYGKFAWVNDPEGNRIELWEPVDGLF